MKIKSAKEQERMLRSCWKKAEKTDRNKLYTGKMDRGIFGIEKEKTVKIP